MKRIQGIAAPIGPSTGSLRQAQGEQGEQGGQGGQRPPFDKLRDRGLSEAVRNGVVEGTKTS